MAEYDDVIKVHLLVNGKGAKKELQNFKGTVSATAKEIEEENQKIGQSFSQMDAKSAEKELKTLESSIAKTADKIASLRSKMDALKDTRIPTEEFNDLMKEASEADKELDKMIAKDSELAKLDEKIEKLSQSSAEYAEKMKEVAEEKTHSVDFSDSVKEVTSLIGKLSQLEEKQNKFLEKGGKKSSGTFLGISSEIEKTKEQIKSLEEYQQNLIKSGKAYVFGTDTEQYKNLSAKYESANQELGKSKDLYDEIKQAQRESAIKLSELVNQIKQLKAEGKDFTLGSDTEEFFEMSEQMEQLNQQMLSDTERQTELQSALAEREEHLAEIRENAVVGNQRIVETLERIRELEQEIADLKAAGITEGYEDYDSRIQELEQLKQEVRDYNNGIKEVKESYSRLGEIVKSSFAKISSTISKAGTGVKKFVGIIGSAFSALSKSQKGSNSSLGLGLRTMLRYGLGIRSLYALVNKLRTAIKEGFSNLYNDKNMASFKASVDDLQASLLTLKNAFAAAFRPIVEIAIPYLQRLTDYMIRLLETVGQFVAAITGQKKYTKAIKQTTAAIEEENAAQNKQLSGLDKLNNLSSGSGSASNSGSTVTMFEEVPLGDSFKNFSQWLSGMWEDADFSDMGKLIGEKLRSALENIPWENIKKTAYKIGSSVATLINGAVETVGLGYSIGNALSQAINTGFEYANSFVHKLHWDSVGTFIAESLNGFFEGFDWPLIRDTFVTGFKGFAEGINSFISDFHWNNISDTLSNAINIIAESAYEFFSTVEWGELGEKIGGQLTDSIKKVDWEEVGKAIGSIIQAALDFLVGFVEKLEFEEAAQAIIDAFQGVFETVDMRQLADTILALLAAKIALGATVSLFKGAAMAILEALGGAFISLGGIGGILTTDLATIVGAGTASEIGLTIGAGIIAGIAAAWTGFNVGKLIGEKLFPEDAEYYQNFKWLGEGGFFDTITSDWKTSLEALDQMITDASNNKFIQFLNGDITGLMGKEHKTWKETKEEILNAFTWIKDEVSREWDVFMKNIDTISNWFENSVKPWFTKEKWTALFQNVKNTASEVWGGIKKIFEGFTTFLLGAFTSNWQQAWDGIVEIFSGVEDVIKGIVNGILGVIESLANGVISGINFVIGALNNLGFDIPDWLKYVPGASKFAGKSFGFNIPELSEVSIPRLATGTVVPPNNEFLAVLGDNKREPEVVSPLSTIEQAVENAMRRNGGMGGGEITIKIPVEIDGRVLFELMKKFDLEQYKRTGRPSFQM